MKISPKTGIGLIALCSGLATGPGWAQQTDPAHEHDHIHGADHEHETLEEVVVTATPLARDVTEMSQSATVMSGTALAREVANNIGDTLSRVPGVSNASFGQNVGRPVIRGLQGARIGVFNDNMSASDASAVSQDHAVSVEPFLADQVEVLRGPATLLYGSGSIGGVVNIVTNTIPKDIPEETFSGRAMIQGDTAADQQFAAGRIDFGLSSFVFHANAFYRRTDDYEIPGNAELFPEEDHDEHDEHEEHEEHEEQGDTLENSFLDNDGGAIGGSWIGENWHFGLSYTTYDSNYGIPGGHHAHHESENDAEHDHEGEEHDHEAEEEHVTIGLESNRLDGELVGTNPFAGFEKFKLRFADTGYEHTEFEGEEVGTVFESDTTDARLELRHNPWGEWKGAFGLQYTDRDFSAIGAEAFAPPSNTTTNAIFWVESFERGEWAVDLGVRYEDVDVRPQHSDPAQAAPEPSGFKPLSASVGTIWHVTEGSHLSFNLSHVERAPTDQELFASGPHIATSTYEVGDPNLETESNVHMEGSYRVHAGRFTGAITVYMDMYNDFIFQRDTGLIEHGFPVRLWSHQDADFIGGELELRYDFGHTRTGHWQVFGFADTVRGKFADNSNVPRMPPKRIGFGLDWDHYSWVGSATWIHASSHKDLADYETPTPGYDLLNAELSYLVPIGARSEWELYLKGHNLLDEDVRNSTSFLKDQAPQIGRNLIFGVRTRF